MDPLTILGIGGKLIEKLSAFFPTPEDKLKAQVALLDLQQKGELAQLAADVQLAQGQIDINREDAKSESPIQRNWRPALGWVCVFAYATQFVIGPIAAAIDPSLNMPKLDLSELGALLFGMLGLSTQRSWEKVKKNA